MRAHTRIIPAMAVVCGLLLAALTSSLADESNETATSQQTGGNAKCYVCHPTLKTEEITTQHLAVDVTCDGCHGASTEHMHDEMLMTPPDLLFGRSEVIAMCSDPSCHAPGEGRTEYGLQDHKDPAKVREFHDEWLGRSRPNGRAITKHPICTDCHGTHNLDEPIAQDRQPEGEWAALFNGIDLAGWQAANPSAWTVNRRSLIGRLEASNQSADIWTRASFENYLLAVTFRADWPIRAGCWLRHTAAAPGPRVEIGDMQDPRAYTGSLRLPGQGLALANLREDLIDRESWNTLAVRVEDRRIQVWLNGEEIGAALSNGPEKGRIGIHLESQTGTNATEIQIREIQVRELGKPESKDGTAGQ